MKMFMICIVLAAFGWAHTQDGSHLGEKRISLVPGYGSVLYSDEVGNLNDYLDKVLQEAKGSFSQYNLDPMRIDTFEHTVQHKVWFVTLNGGFRVSNGVARGLSSLHRAGHATLRIDDATNVVHVDGSLGTNNVQVTADVHAWYSFIKLNLQLSGSASYISASVKLELPLNNQNFKPRATHFYVNQISSFQLKVTGLGILNWLAEKIINSYVGDLRNFINNNFARLALDAINNKIGDVITPDMIPSVL